MKSKIILITSIVVFLIAVILAVAYFWQKNQNLSGKNSNPTVCTLEAKICPDGSSVGRNGPDCEFSQCPAETADWKTYSNSDYNFEFKYPADFFAQNQQPKLLIGDCDYKVFPDKCPSINNIVIKDLSLEGGDLNIIKNNLSTQDYWDNPNGEKQTINNTPYCLYTTGDAAMGRAFNYYYYATVKEKKCLVVYLSTSTTNCDFYLPLEDGNTEQAKNYNNCLITNKNQPIILEEIISTFKFNK